MYYEKRVKNRNLGLLLVFFCACLFLAAPAYALEAIGVPWNPADPNYINEESYHNTYDGAEITLKGIARDVASNLEFRWDFGDGGSTAWTSASSPYNLGVNHIYTGIVGQVFIATLYVRDSSADESQAQYVKTSSSQTSSSTFCCLSNPVQASRSAESMIISNDAV